MSGANSKGTRSGNDPPLFVDSRKPKIRRITKLFNVLFTTKWKERNKPRLFALASKERLLLGLRLVSVAWFLFKLKSKWKVKIGKKNDLHTVWQTPATFLAILSIVLLQMAIKILRIKDCYGCVKLPALFDIEPTREGKQGARQNLNWLWLERRKVLEYYFLLIRAYSLLEYALRMSM